MKKILLCVLSMIICFSLVGCTQEKKEEIGLDDLLNIFENNEESDSSKDSSSDKNTEEEIKLYSDDSKLVFNFYDIYNLVYYFEKDKITGLEYYYNYSTEELATYAKASLEQEKDEEVKSIVQKGKYIIVTFKESAYKDMTVDEVKQTYSYLDQVLK